MNKGVKNVKRDNDVKGSELKQGRAREKAKRCNDSDTLRLTTDQQSETLY